MHDDDRTFGLPSLGLVVGIGLFFGIVWLSWGAIRDSYQRQALWDNTASPTERLQAAELWGRMGRAAVGEMTRALSDGDYQVRRYAALALCRIGSEAESAVPDLVRLLDDDDRLVRTNAITALGRIGCEAEFVVPRLVDVLIEDAATCEVAAEALVRFAPASDAAVTKLLHNPDPRVRRHALSVLGQSDTEDPAVIEAIRGRLTDPDAAVRREAFGSLRWLRVLNVEDVGTMLRDEDPQNTRSALRYLPQLGADARQALPEVVSLCSSANPRTRRHAFAALHSVIEQSQQRSPTTRLAGWPGGRGQRFAVQPVKFRTRWSWFRPEAS